MKKLLIIILFAALSLPLRSELDNRVIDTSLCGLSFIHKAVKVSMRTEEINIPGNTMPVTINITELPENCYDIIAAYVWSTVSYTSRTTDNAEYTVVSPAGDIHKYKATMTGQEGQKCWLEIGTRGYRADVASAITGNGQYRISINTGNKETDGITLLIIYQDRTADWTGHIIINDGLITKGENLSNTSLVMKDFSVCEKSDDAWAFLIASDLQESENAPVKFTMNGDVANYHRDFWNSEAVKTHVSNQQSTSAFGIDNCSCGDCYSWLMMGLYYRSDNCQKCESTTNLANLNTDYLIDFGRICTGEEIETDLKLNNMGSRNVRINNIYLKNNTGDLVIVDRVTEVLPNQSAVQKLKFKPGELKNYSDSVVIESDDLCTSPLVIAVKGTGVARIEVSLPDTLVYIGKYIGIPLKARLICGSLPASALIYDGEIRFDATAFLPDRQLNNGLFDKGIQSSERIIDVMSPDMIVNGKDILLNTITGRVMLALMDIVPLKFKRFNWNNEFIDNLTKDGCLRLEGLCQRNLSRVKSLELGMTIQPNPATDKAEIHLTGEKTGLVSISVCTINGSIKETQKCYKPAYDYSKEIDLKDYSTGMYVVMINIGEIYIADVLFVVK